jgi:hypothetical protein
MPEPLVTATAEAVTGEHVARDERDSPHLGQPRRSARTEVDDGGPGRGTVRSTCHCGTCSSSARLREPRQRRHLVGQREGDVARAATAALAGVVQRHARHPLGRAAREVLLEEGVVVDPVGPALARHRPVGQHGQQ